MLSNTRLYGAAIAFASGLYSLWSVAAVSRMGTSGWIMGVIGVVVVVHGAVLLTDAADRLGNASGPLMIGYAIVMLLTQALLGSGMMTGAAPAGMGGDGMMGEPVMSAWGGTRGWSPSPCSCSSAASS